MGLELKKGLTKYLQAREFRKASKETLKFVKVFTAHFLAYGFSFVRRRSQTGPETPCSDKIRRCQAMIPCLYSAKED